ncbi:acyltransferase [Panacibacter ginsenosidivorans]|uniref:Acyltransferase n=1 Tax=Panacibacter ginsenosidivorans TaxID=1813871 RepID=A0A5B8V6X2_9BACT|nr:acyltransferase [Panacibacter ginsenosidivorans]QEC66643.1 acyltransferase [Panacibacter ginsenosidivorans]
MSFAEKIKSDPKLKKIVHRLIIPKGEAKPRLWVKLFLNRWFHTYGKGSKVRSYTRMDLLPFNKFELGHHSTIENFSTVNNGVGHVIIGYNTLIGMGNVVIGPAVIGNNVILAQNIVMSGLNHEYKDVTKPIHAQPVTTAQITIEDDCWIGANAVVTAGVTIGKHSVIAAGSVVTKDIPPYSVAVGNPAKVIKTYDHEIGEWIKVVQEKNKFSQGQII